MCAVGIGPEQSAAGHCSSAQCIIVFLAIKSLTCPLCEAQNVRHWLSFTRRSNQNVWLEKKQGDAATIPRFKVSAEVRLCIERELGHCMSHYARVCKKGLWDSTCPNAVHMVLPK